MVLPCISGACVPYDLLDVNNAWKKAIKAIQSFARSFFKSLPAHSAVSLYRLRTKSHPAHRKKRAQSSWGAVLAVCMSLTAGEPCVLAPPRPSVGPNKKTKKEFQPISSAVQTQHSHLIGLRQRCSLLHTYSAITKDQASYAWFAQKSCPFLQRLRTACLRLLQCRTRDSPHLRQIQQHDKCSLPLRVTDQKVAPSDRHKLLMRCQPNSVAIPQKFLSLQLNPGRPIPDKIGL
eukprot:scaffold46186_cov21-Tisochrysis_lutea.AAC.1